MGILTQADTVTLVNLGDGTTSRMPDLPATVNGAGYNVLDGLVYVWDYAGGIGRFGADSTYEFIGLPEGMANDNWHIGDVDLQGSMWLAYGMRDRQWVEVDVRPGSATFGQIISRGNLVYPTGMSNIGVDWSAVPGHDNYLYSIGQLSGPTPRQFALLRFDKTSGELVNLGAVPAATGLGGFGATFADAAGFLYGSDNNSGTIIRVDIATGTSEFFADGPPSSSNDGARCPLTNVQVDFGDAPDSYGSTLGSDGARASLRGLEGNVAPLMLGTSVTAETDAKLVDSDEDDALSEGSPDLVLGETGSVTVSVTNTSDAPATLAAWFDQDQSGTFDDDELLQTAPIGAASGLTTHALSLPASDQLGQTWLRLRVLRDDSDLSPTGTSAGEVEDWAVTVREPEPGLALTKTVTPATFESVGDTLIWTVSATNTGEMTLDTLDVNDPMCELEGPQSEALARQETRVFTCEYVVTQDDLEAGTVTNIASGLATAGSVDLNDTATATATLTTGEDPGDPASPSPTPEAPQQPASPSPTPDATQPGQPASPLPTPQPPLPTPQRPSPGLPKTGH